MVIIKRGTNPDDKGLKPFAWPLLTVPQNTAEQLCSTAWKTPQSCSTAVCGSSNERGAVSKVALILGN